MEISSSNNIRIYNEIVRLRNIMKVVQQLSWDVTTMDKRYPLDKLSEDELPDVLEAFQGFYDRFLRTYRDAVECQDMSEVRY